MFCFCFLFCNNSCQTNYPKIYQTDLRQIFRVGKTTAVDDQSEVSFSILRGTLSWQPIYGFVHKTDLRHAVTPVASGAAGRANYGLCPASSFFSTEAAFILERNATWLNVTHATQRKTTHGSASFENHNSAADQWRIHGGDRPPP